MTDFDEHLLPLCPPPDGVRIAAMAKNCHNDYKMKFSVDEEFPDLSVHNNHMAKVLLPSNRKRNTIHAFDLSLVGKT